MNIKKNNNLTSTVIILFLVVILIIIFIGLFAKFSNIFPNPVMKEYDVQLPIKDDGKNMNICPEGCNRGMCNRTNSDNSCKFDFQCQYCQDSKTNMFYANFDKEREIVPLYEEEELLTPKQENSLNKEISENNDYIHKLNNKIRMLNNGE